MPRPSTLWQENFKFSLYVYVKQVTPEPVTFLPQGSDLINVVKGLLDEASYQISKAWTF